MIWVCKLHINGDASLFPENVWKHKYFFLFRLLTKTILAEVEKILIYSWIINLSFTNSAHFTKMPLDFIKLKL